MTASSDLKEQLIQFFEEAQKNYEHIFLVDFVKNPKTNDFTFIVDGVEPVQLNQIAHISRLISKQIDEYVKDETAFKFQVSTPGADKPLKMPKQYYKHVGRTLTMLMQDDSKLEGKILKVSNDGIDIITIDNKKKGISSEEITVDFDQIKEAKIKLEF